MNQTLNVSSKIRKLLWENTVMSLKQLRYQLNNRPRSSLFRDLKKLDLNASYPHTGQYHALKKTARFDSNGFWFFQDIGFSQQGTLKKTLRYSLSHSQAGMTHKEMRQLFRVEVQKPITDLVNTRAITRQLLPNDIYVYLNADKLKAQEHFKRRLSLSDRMLDTTLAPKSIRIEILVEVIQSPERTFDETVLGPLLRKRGVITKNDEVA